MPEKLSLSFFVTGSLPPLLSPLFHPPLVYLGKTVWSRFCPGQARVKALPCSLAPRHPPLPQLLYEAAGERRQEVRASLHIPLLKSLWYCDYKAVCLGRASKWDTFESEAGTINNYTRASHRQSGSPRQAEMNGYLSIGGISWRFVDNRRETQGKQQLKLNYHSLTHGLPESPSGSLPWEVSGFLRSYTPCSWLKFGEGEGLMRRGRDWCEGASFLPCPIGWPLATCGNLNLN